MAYGNGSWVTVVVTVTCCTCCTPVPTSTISLDAASGAPPWLPYTETEISIESPRVVEGRLKPNWPLNSAPPLTDVKTVLAEPKPVFEAASYALPVA